MATAMGNANTLTNRGELISKSISSRKNLENIITNYKTANAVTSANPGLM